MPIGHIWTRIWYVGIYDQQWKDFTQALTENRIVCRSQRRGGGLEPAVADVPEVLLVDPAEKSNAYSKTQRSMKQRSNEHGNQDVLHPSQAICSIKKMKLAEIKYSPVLLARAWSFDRGGADDDEGVGVGRGGWDELPKDIGSTTRSESCLASNSYNQFSNLVKTWHIFLI